VTGSVTSPHEQFRAGVRQFLSVNASSANIRRLLDDPLGYDRRDWAVLSDQLGLTALGIAEECGGTGAGVAELAIAQEELGHTLFNSPFFATSVLAAQALSTCAEPTFQQRWLPEIAAGTRTATLALAEVSGAWDLAGVATSAERIDDHWRLRGEKMFVVDGDSADLLLVVARVDSELGLFAVEADATGLSRTRLALLDGTRRMARLSFADVAAIRVSGPRDCTAGLRRLLDLISVAVASEQLGGAQRCLDMAVEYAKVRVQFDRPIGSFQAIKHQCADLLVQIESARSAVRAAVAGADRADAEFSIAAAVAQIASARAFTEAAKRNIQIHGGIGYTWEHDAHLFLRRAKSSELLFGSPTSLRERIAANSIEALA
jgi:alkylation response protein AidB-like acyl-CoA dehydrogenase